MRDQLVATNLVPFSGGRNLRRAQRVDAQSDRRSPWRRILKELHPFSVVCEEEWAGCFQSLFCDHLLIGIHFKLRAHRNVGPNDTDYIGTGLFAEPEMEQRSSDRLL